MEKKVFTRQNLQQNIEEATILLLQMAKDLCWNDITDEVKYVIKRVNLGVENTKNFRNRDKERRKILNKKERLTLDSAIQELSSDFDNIYLIELYIFKARRKETIVEIEVLERSELIDPSDLDSEVNKNYLHQNMMLHCKVPVPPYANEDKKIKFDINWQLGTLEHKWKLFWWKRKIKRKYNLSLLML